MKAIIAGSRNIIDYNVVKNYIDSLKLNITEIICGGARGVDLLGKQYGEENKIKVTMFFPDWKKHGKIAGITRNKLMVDCCDAGEDVGIFVSTTTEFIRWLANDGKQGNGRLGGKSKIADA